MKREKKHNKIKINKSSSKYMINIGENSAIKDFLEEIKQHQNLIKKININLLLDNEKNNIKKGTCHIIEKKNRIYTIFCTEEYLILSRKEKKKEKIKENILTWNSTTNTINYKTYIDKIDRKRILEYEYNEKKEYSKEEELLKKDIEQLLEEFEEIGYKIPIKTFEKKEENEKIKRKV